MEQMADTVETATSIESRAGYANMRSTFSQMRS